MPPPASLRVSAAACAALTLASCTWEMEDLRFRTREPETAFERAVRSVEAHCWGVKLADAERGLIYSKWQAWPTGEGVYLSRCLVVLVPQPEDRSADVRLTFAMKKCPLADLDDVEKLAETCTFTTIVPGTISDQLVPAGKRIETDLRR